MTSDQPDFSHVSTWVFDLDNTLYPAHCNLFKQIDTRMTQFIQDRFDIPHEKARFIQKDYYARYGTTLSGLMKEHSVAPEDFMDFVHDIDLQAVDENETLAAIISSLPGEKYIFTNGSVKHADNVVGKLGLAGLFDDVFDIAAAGFTPKPHRETYEKFIKRHQVSPNEAAMFEDLAHNLEAAHALGMTTVLVTSQAAWLDDEPIEKRPAKPDDVHDHVHHQTDDLTAFLSRARTSPTQA